MSSSKPVPATVTRVLNRVQLQLMTSWWVDGLRICSWRVGLVNTSSCLLLMTNCYGCVLCIEGASVVFIVVRRRVVVTCLSRVVLIVEGFFVLVICWVEIHSWGCFGTAVRVECHMFGCESSCCSGLVAFTSGFIGF